jgi:hypothetical protein
MLAIRWSGACWFLTESERQSNAEHIAAEVERQRQREHALDDARARRAARQAQDDAEAARVHARNVSATQQRLDDLRQRNAERGEHRR